MTETFVYTLEAPSRPDGVYVGTTIDPQRRYRDHLRDILDPENCSAKADFFRTVLEEGGEVVMVVIDVLPTGNAARELESRLIKQVGNLNKKRSSYRLSYIVEE